MDFLFLLFFSIFLKLTGLSSALPVGGDRFAPILAVVLFFVGRSGFLSSLSIVFWAARVRLPFFNEINNVVRLGKVGHRWLVGFLSRFFASSVNVESQFSSTYSAFVVFGFLSRLFFLF